MNMSLAGDDPMEMEVERDEYQAASGKTRRLTIPASPFLIRKQRLHFALFYVLPAIGTVFVLFWNMRVPAGKPEFTLFAVFWLLTGLGFSAGFHRHFAHHAFQATKAVRVLLAICGSMAGLGPVVSWIAMHRRHHHFSDRVGDLHSPNVHGDDWRGRLRGLVHAQMTWMTGHEFPNIIHYAKDAIEDRTVLWASRHYNVWVVLGLLLPAAIDGVWRWSWTGVLQGFLWGGVVRMFVVAQCVHALNSLTHAFGSRPFRVRDRSGNSAVIGLFTWGEGWHHNHHAFPSSASVALAWYRVDLSFWLILALAKCRLAWDVKVPTRAQIAGKRRGSERTVGAGVYPRFESTASEETTCEIQPRSKPGVSSI